MIGRTLALTRALVRSCLADRTSMVLSLVAPIAFFTLIGSFYRHLESPEGIRVVVTLVDEAGNDDAARMARAVRAAAVAPVEIVGTAPGGMRPFAEIRLPPGFSGSRPEALVRSEIPLPAGNAAIRQLVELAALRAFGGDAPAIRLRIEERPGRLLRDAVAGIGIVFVMFSVSSLASRGLADDAAGLRARLASLGVGRSGLVVARVLAMSSIGWAQLAATVVWAGVAFGVRPLAPLALLASTALAVTAIAATFQLLATASGGRSRFVVIAPVVTLALGAFSGGLIPRFVLPAWMSAVGGTLFPAWGIDACRVAIEGGVDLPALAGLAAVTAVAIVAAARWPRGERAP